MPRITIKAHPFRDRFSRWPVVLALYDGRSCPQCGAVVCTWQARNLHDEWHREQRQWHEAVLRLTRACEEAGLIRVREATEDDDDVLTGNVLEPGQDDEYDEGED